MKPNINHLIIIIISAMFLYIVYQYYIISSYKEQQTQISIQQKQLLDDIIRAQKNVVTKTDLEKISKDLDIKLDPIREDLKKFSADIKGINSVTVVSPGYTGTYVSDKTTPKDPKESTVSPEAVDFVLKNTQGLSLYEPFENNKIKIGEVSFSSWRKEPWSVNMYPKTYRLVNVIGSDENGSNYVYNKFFIDVNGKSYPIKIQSSVYSEDTIQSKFRFSPKLYLGINTKLYVNNVSLDFGPSLSMFLFSYGKFIKNPDWIFIGPGFDGAINKKNIGINVGLFGYNVGKHIPFMSNLFIGPDISVDADKNLAIAIGFKAGL